MYYVRIHRIKTYGSWFVVRCSYPLSGATPQQSRIFLIFLGSRIPLHVFMFSLAKLGTRDNCHITASKLYLDAKG